MKISIIGAAGGVGSAVAYTLLERCLADEIMMIDININSLKAHVIDLQLCQVNHPGCKVNYGDYSNAENSDFVIICASISPNDPKIKDRLDYLERNKAIIKEIVEKLMSLKRIGIIITATNPVDVLNYLVFKIGKWERKQILGFNWNDTYRLQYYTAMEKGVLFNQVYDALCVGEHGQHQIPLFSNIHLGEQGGLKYEDVKNIKARLDQFYIEWRSLRSGRTTCWLSAQGIAEMVRSINSPTPKVIPCSAVLEGEFGLNNISIGVPALVGQGSFVKVIEETVSKEDKKELVAVAEKLKPFIQNIK